MPNVKSFEQVATIFIDGEQSWHTDENNLKTKSVVYWLAALRAVKRKPLEDAQLQFRLVKFLEEKVNEASEYLMKDVMQTLDEI